MASPAKQPLGQLGSGGPWIPIVGFGLMGMSVAYGDTESDEARLKVLDRAWEIGCTHWDTADVYGDSEDLIGKWFKLHPERRGDIFLASKFAVKVVEDVNDQELSALGRDSSPQYCSTALEQSLKRLGVDSIDLYYVHRVDKKTPVEETMQVLKQFKEQGKIKHIGLSEVSSNTLRRAHAIHPIAAVQVEYSPWNLEIEGPAGTHLMETCEELGVAIIAYSPLGRGILTGRYRSLDDFDPSDTRRFYDRFQPDNFAKNIELVDQFTGLAQKKGCTPSQLVLAWLSLQSDRSRVFVIPGTKSIKYLEENVKAAHVKLSNEEQAQLRALASASEPKGDRQLMFGQYVESVPLDN